MKGTNAKTLVGKRVGLDGGHHWHSASGPFCIMTNWSLRAHIKRWTFILDESRGSMREVYFEKCTTNSTFAQAPRFHVIRKFLQTLTRCQNTPAQTHKCTGMTNCYRGHGRGAGFRHKVVMGSMSVVWILVWHLDVDDCLLAKYDARGKYFCSAPQSNGDWAIHCLGFLFDTWVSRVGNSL